jgi:GlpG protein
MRQIGTIPDPRDAQSLADYLLTLGITTKLVESPGGTAVWVHREEKIEQARRELADFQADPQAPKFQGTERAAEALRKKARREEREHRRKSVDLRGRLNVASFWRCPVTYILIWTSIAVGVLTVLGDKFEALRPLLFTRFRTVEATVTYKQDDGTVVSKKLAEFQATGLDAIKQGQVWRLITPIFIHFGLLHIVFNMFWLYRLGALIEMRLKPGTLLALALVSAVGSNLAEYGWQTYRFGPEHIHPFGGMSGVVYALFGFVWMKSDYDPERGIKLPSNTILWMMGWLFFCMTGAIGGVANAAHVGGLLVGLVIGLAPYLWDELRWGRR